MVKTVKHKQVFHMCLSALTVVCMLLSLPNGAYADDTGLKGYVAAESIELDRGAYADPAAYVNVPANVSTVRIGLRYANSAVEDAQFINDSGGGFAFGEYDEQRRFHEAGSTTVDNILLVCVPEKRGWRLHAFSAYDYEPLYISDKNPGSIALVPLGEEGRTWFRGELYRGGFECNVEREYLLDVINCVELEDYVKGVVPYEMSNNWPYEALRAQAVCARTYVVYNQNHYEEYHFDLTNDTECQVYRGVLEANDTTDRAVDSTAGEYVRYEGEICEVYYFASDGGATEDGANVFGSDRPYLTGKVDPFEKAVDYSFSSWEEWRTGENISWLLANKGYALGTVIRVEPEYSALGNVIAVELYDDLGGHVRLEGKEAYTTLLLNNCRYRVDVAGKYFWFQGSGWGHNCGMSQWGARAMASVYGYDYQDIIRFYFTGAYVA